MNSIILKPKKEKRRPIKRDKREKKATLLLVKWLTSRKSKKLLGHQARNSITSHINHKVYHILCDPYTFINAYAKISKNKGALTKGVSEDEQVMLFFGQFDATKIAQKFKEGKYKFKPTRRKWIPKPGKKKMRPIDTPTQEDRIVQEAIRGILEAIFEPEFAEFETANDNYCTNFGFRPNLSCSNAIDTITSKGRANSFVIEGDIVSAYNNIDHKILLSLIKKRVKDKKFLKVLKELLESGVMDGKQYIHTLLGTPQGGIVSPLLFNIYMFEFDKFIYSTYIKPYQEIKQPKPLKDETWQNIGYAMRNKFRDAKLAKTPEERQNLLEEAKVIEEKRMKITSTKKGTKKQAPLFVRYADDWVLLLDCPAKTTLEVMENIKIYLITELKLPLDVDKTLISHLQGKGFKFLGFEMKMWAPRQNKIARVLHPSKEFRFKQRVNSRNIVSRPDKQRILQRLIYMKRMCKKDGFPIGVRPLTMLEEYRIVLSYRMIMIGIANYYIPCDQHYSLNQISYILQYSCAKTLATRKRKTMPQIFAMYGKNLTIKVPILGKDNKETIKTISFLTYTDLKRSKLFEKNRLRNLTPFDPFKTNIYNRTKFKMFSCCCICGSEDRISMHHHKSLRGIKEDKRKKVEYLRSRLKRLQIPVCFPCHMDITHGRYDNPKSPVEFYDEWMAKL